MYISHRGKTYPNNSNIPITDIGEEDSGAVLCKTNLYDCCKSDQTNDSMVLGEWFCPNLSSNYSINSEHCQSKFNETFKLYRNRDRSVVRLNRRGNILSPTGKFCCRIRDASYTFIKMCVNLGELESS